MAFYYNKSYYRKNTKRDMLKFLKNQSLASRLYLDDPNYDIHITDEDDFAEVEFIERTHEYFDYDIELTEIFSEGIGGFGEVQDDILFAYEFLTEESDDLKFPGDNVYFLNPYFKLYKKHFIHKAKMFKRIPHLGTPMEIDKDGFEGNSFDFTALSFIFAQIFWFFLGFSLFSLFYVPLWEAEVYSRFGFNYHNSSFAFHKYNRLSKGIYNYPPFPFNFIYVTKKK